MSAYRIRQTTDTEIIKQIYKICMPEDDWYISKYPVVWWVVWYGAIPVGYCSLTIFTNEIAFLSRSGILPSHQGRGLHRRMIRAREQYCWRNRHHTIVTYTTKDNIKSMHNLSRCSYHPYDPETPLGDKNCIHWMRKLG